MGEWNRKRDVRQFRPIASTDIIGHDGKAVTTLDHFAVCRPQSLLIREMPELLGCTRDYLSTLDALIERFREIDRPDEVEAIKDARKPVAALLAKINKTLAPDLDDEPGGREVREQIAAMLDKRSAEVRAMAERQEDRESRETLLCEANALRDAAEAARNGKWPENTDGD